MSTPDPSDALVHRPLATTEAEPAVRVTEPGPPAKRSRLPWLVGAIVLAVLVFAGIGTAVFLVLTPTTDAGPSSAVLGFDQAYAEADCELFAAVTTVDYREAVAPTCADFEAEAQAFVDNFSDYDVVIDSTRIDGETATIATTESWVIDGQEASAAYTYTLVDAGGAWRIDALE